jgi:tetratricopeptide (TPR) repeat protein
MFGDPTAHAIVVAALAVIVGCGRDGGTRAAPCARATPVVARAAACDERAANGDAAAALLAAHAYRELGRGDDALRLAGVAALAGDPAGSQLVGELHLEAERYAAALPALEAALAGHQQRGDHRAIADAAILLSRWAWEQSAFGPAFEHAALAVEAAGQGGDAAGQGAAYSNLGSVLSAAGDARRALDAFDAASRLLPASDVAARARVLLFRGLIHDERGHGALAAPIFDEARAAAASAGDWTIVLAAEINLAHLALGAGRFAEAARHLDAAEAAHRRSGASSPSRGILLNRAVLLRKQKDVAGARAALDAAADGAPPETAWLIAHERGWLALADGDVELADRSFVAAVETVEAMRAEDAPEETRTPFLEDRWEPFESLVALRLDRGDVRGALAIVARAQGRMFVDAFAAAIADAPEPGRPVAEAAERRLALARALVPALGTTPLGARSPSAFDLAALGGRHVITYFVGDGRMRAIAIAGGVAIATPVSVPVGELATMIDDWLGNPDDPALAERLGNALLPAGALPAGGGRVAIVPVGPLLRLPFAALRPGGARVLDRYDLVYAPSLVAMTAEATRERRARATSAVVIADARRDLGAAASEAEVVRGATDADVRSGAEATIAVLRAAADADLLHVISHSGVSHEGGYLVLADGEVSASQILEWKLRPRIAVLPTCASASTVHGEMWGSLAAAFLAAGSEHVVATLASVDDRLAAELVAAFYANGGARDPVTALARAQRLLARSHSTAEWSAFLVAGL